MAIKMMRPPSAAMIGGLSFGTLTIQTGGGNSQVVIGANRILVYGVTTLTAGDFTF